MIPILNSTATDIVISAQIRKARNVERSNMGNKTGGS